MILDPGRLTFRDGNMATMESDNTAVGPGHDGEDTTRARAQGFGSFLEMFQSASTTDSERER
ncbi:hypothetical protein CH275_23155 [Rhodococcus sp. 06-235-1A]|nr:hypothetical protein CH275_23155 [Rhodococcus sp. 06-235-1A]